MEYRRTIIEQRVSDNNQMQRDIPSFIEPLPPLISNPFMRPKPVKGTNLLEQFEEDSELEEPELVQVYLRLKPCDVRSNLYEVRSDQCLITSVDTATAGHGRRTQHNVSKAYTFTKIFGPEANQKEIFETVVKDNLRQLADGHSYTLLTYGASGSGKTYTLMGTVHSPGLVPRSLEYVFRVVDAAQQPLCKPSENGAEKLGRAQQDYELQWVKKLRHVSAPLRDKYRRMSAQLRSDLSSSTSDLTDRTRYYVWVSFIEIYNEAIYDLLVSCDRRASSKLRIREDASGQVYVKGATQAFVRSGEEAYDVLVAGKHNLQVAATGVHAHSSRSHCIFTITLLTETDSGDMRVACVRLCDLAGSERQANTRNAGARMAESRAINSSLHVLERCLHMLRRRRRPGTNPGLVPYRESKLTRLLGTGLSGSRGEAVSMVVAVNPEPARAHETRHVLQLAAVARDIQVNSTMAESIFDSEPDTTLAASAELMRLRADNERLHFELVQTQSRNKELLCSMAEKQQEAAGTMRELVEEAKDITKQFYEAQMASLEHRLRNEMEDLIEEYENKLRAIGSPSKSAPLKSMENMVSQLSTEISILEEKLCAEQLARARAEQEVQHLRACIEERDHEKCPEDKAADANRDVLLLSDAEQSDEDDLNESLEPSFRKEDLNATAQGRQYSEHPDNSDSDHDTTLDNTAKSATGLQQSSIDIKSEPISVKSSVENDDRTETTFDNASNVLKRSSFDTKERSVENASASNVLERSSIVRNKSLERAPEDSGEEYNSCNEQSGEINDRRSTFSRNVVEVDNDSFKRVIETKRGTYYIGNDIEHSVDSGCSISKTNRESRDSALSEDNMSKDKSSVGGNVNVSFEGKTVGKVSKTVVEKLKSQVSIDNLTVNDSLSIFEQFEKETQCTDEVKKQLSEELISVKLLKEEDKGETQMDTSEKAVNMNLNKNKSAFDASKEEYAMKHSSEELINENLLKESRTNFENNKGEKPMDTSEKEVDINLPTKKYFFDAAKADNSVESLEKCSDSILLFAMQKKPCIDIDAIEFQGKTPQNNIQKDANKVSENKRHYFENKEIHSEIIENNGEPTAKTATEHSNVTFGIAKHIDKEISNEMPCIETGILKEKPTYFDDVDKNPTEVKSSKVVNNLDTQFDDLRSPSIVKDQVPKDYEPRTIKKLLGESFTTNLTLSATKCKMLSRIQDSFDIFEEANSPQLAETEENLCVEGIQSCLKKFSIVDGPKESAKQKEVFEKLEYIPKESVKTEEITKTYQNDTYTQLSNTSAKLTRSKRINTNETLDRETKQLESESKTTNDITGDNSIDAFENIYKDVTAPRVTEFELLVTQEINETHLKEVELASSDRSTAKYNETHHNEIDLASSDNSTAKYNLRQLNNAKTDNKPTKNSKSTDVNLSKAHSNEDLTKSVKYNLRHLNREEEVTTSKSTIKSKRSLRLRRRKNVEDDTVEDERRTEKFKDIANLQKEFADVVADAPEVRKEVINITSPEKDEEENIAPLAALSCPSKSVTRSRRKLFTPRAEPLEDSLNTGDSNERVCVPRPSYHRGRARRKL